MLDIHYIRENRDEVKERLAIKNFTELNLVDKVIAIDENRRKIQKELDDVLAELNQSSRAIGQLFKEGKATEANELKEQSAKYKERSKELEEDLRQVVKELEDELFHIPNAAQKIVPVGNSEEDNELIKEWGDLPSLNDDALPHWELAKKFELFDLDLGSKITGAGFPVYTGKGAKLQRSLINFFLDQAIENGFQEVIPPLLVNEDSAYGTGQLPDKEGQMYITKDDPFYLIPTAEVPITNIYRDTIIDEKDLPVKLVGHTPCFRREAGSYGKEVRGLNRVHQFDKVEIVQITSADRSEDALLEMVGYVEGLLKKLELPYRVLKLCGGDLGFASAITYDLEVYSAAQDMWLEVSSVSNFETFQSNRLKTRIKDSNNKKSLAHTLNGSALALPRIVAALLENNQKGDSIRIPEALVPYTFFSEI